MTEEFNPDTIPSVNAFYQGSDRRCDEAWDHVVSESKMLFPGARHYHGCSVAKEEDHIKVSSTEFLWLVQIKFIASAQETLDSALHRFTSEVPGFSLYNVQPRLLSDDPFHTTSAPNPLFYFRAKAEGTTHPKDLTPIPYELSDVVEG